jgi:hypothetical protein
MRSYLKLTCSVCNRQKDMAVNTKSFKFPKCSITLGCNGILKPFQYTESPDLIPDTAPAGSQNWFSRFSSTFQVNNQIPQEFPITFSENSIMVVGVKIPDASLVGNDQLLLELKTPSTDVKQFREYVFNTTNQIDRLVGVESASSRKVLRFISNSATPEEVAVFKNGVKLDEGVGPDQYQVSRANNTIQQNAVILNSAVRGANQFKIVVSKPVPDNSVILTLNKNTITTKNQTCWDNVDFVKFRGDKFFLFFCDFSITNFKAGKSFSITDVSIKNASGTIGVPMVDVMILASGGPTQIDRILTKAVKLDTLAGVDEPFTVTEVDDVIYAWIDEKYFSDMTPLMVPGSFTTENLLTSSVDNTQSFQLSNSVIIGPLQ